MNGPRGVEPGPVAKFIIGILLELAEIGAHFSAFWSRILACFGNVGVFFNGKKCFGKYLKIT